MVVLDRDEDDIVIRDTYLQKNYSKNRTIPSQLAIRHSYTENELPVARSSVTTGPIRLTDGSEVRNTYEWEASGIMNEIESENLAVEFGIISVITDNFN